MALVLLIEDNLEIRENVTEILDLAGHDVFVAENGTTGLLLAAEKLPHLILCDILMPETNGYDVIKGLKENPDTSCIPFIFVTASAEKTDVMKGLGMGADGYIRKPFELEELLETIEPFIAKYR